MREIKTYTFCFRYKYILLALFLLSSLSSTIVAWTITVPTRKKTPFVPSALYPHELSNLYERSTLVLLGVAKKARIESGASSFVDLFARNESVIVDKTLLIEKFWDHPEQTFLMAFPPRWGKSINLSMLYEFFSLKLNSAGSIDKQSYQLGKTRFSRLKIGKTSLMSEYGKYPVLYVDMTTTKNVVYNEFLNEMKVLISELYKKHFYLANSLTKHDKKEFEKYIERSNDLTSAELSSSVQNLSKLLSENHKQKTIILMDDYDAVYNYLYSEPDVSPLEERKINNFLRVFYEKTFKKNPYKIKSLMTGVFRFVKSSSFSGLTDVYEHDVTSTEFSKYYGFTQNEVNYLYQKFGIINTDEKEQITNWYGGYYQGTFDEFTKIYSPQSISRYLYTREFRTYWNDKCDYTLSDFTIFFLVSAKTISP